MLLNKQTAMVILYATVVRLFSRVAGSVVKSAMISAVKEGLVSVRPITIKTFSTVATDATAVVMNKVIQKVIK